MTSHQSGWEVNNKVSMFSGKSVSQNTQSYWIKTTTKQQSRTFSVQWNKAKTPQMLISGSQNLPWTCYNLKIKSKWMHFSFAYRKRGIFVDHESFHGKRTFLTQFSTCFVFFMQNMIISFLLLISGWNDMFLCHRCSGGSVVELISSFATP